MTPEEAILLLRNLSERKDITKFEYNAIAAGVDALEKTVEN